MLEYRKTYILIIITTLIMFEVSNIRKNKNGQKTITIPAKINLGVGDFIVFKQKENGDVEIFLNGKNS